MNRDERLSFTIDTHLIRELGRLLVGRDSTALLELIKNAYDADASVVTVEAKNLNSPGDGEIIVTDDGNGMTFDRFRDAFLRIAGRDKEGARYSPRYGRRVTGAKGIGRLASQKLAPQLSIHSIPNPEAINSADGVHATVNWDAIENEHSDLTDLGDSLVARVVTAQPGTTTGTTLHLTNIRDVWSQKRLGPFLSEIRSAQAAEILTQPLPGTIARNPLIFETPTVRDSGKNDPGFRLDLSGHFEAGDDLWQVLLDRFSWVIEVESTADYVKYAVSPTDRKRRSIKGAADPTWARAYYFETGPVESGGPHFHARIFVLEGSIGRRQDPLSRLSRTDSGVRVFLEGFRVLPYGSPGNDWLSLDLDMSAKSRDYETAYDARDMGSPQNPAYYHLGNRQYYGGVFLTEKGAPNLESVVNREGFVPNEYFDELRTVVRTAIDLSVRARAALDRRVKAAEAEASRDAAIDELRDDARSPAAADISNAGSASGGDPRYSDPASASPHIGDDENASDNAQRSLLKSINRARDSIREMRENPALIGPQGEGLKRISDLLSVLTIDAEYLGQEQLSLRTLAAVGTQYAAFIHEINGLLAQSQSLRDITTRFYENSASSLPTPQRRTVRAIRDSTDELVQALTRQSSYLMDVVGPDARRRRRRMNLRERVDAALRIMAPRISERNLSVQIAVSDEIQTPPIFPAELAIIFTNLLTNAIKFSNPDGTIRIGGSLDSESSLHIVVENTGTPVRPEDWARFFRPFESTTTSVDVLLGQGMGMGLPIVKNLATDYNGEAYFRSPSLGYDTALEVVIPDARPAVARQRAARK